MSNPERGSALKIILIIVAVIVVLIAACGGLAWWGMSQVKEQVKVEAESHPLIKEHIGTIEDIGMNMMATGEASEGGGGDFMVYNLTGSKGSGQLKVSIVNNKVKLHSLKTNGQEIPLVAGVETPKVPEKTPEKTPEEVPAPGGG